MYNHIFSAITELNFFKCINVSNYIINSLRFFLIFKLKFKIFFTYYKFIKTCKYNYNTSSTSINYTGFLRTGSISGVCFKISSPVSRTFSRRLQNHHTFLATLTAFSAITLITVRIVPSFGFVTALYAIFAPSCIAFAKTFVVISEYLAVSEQKPLKI